ncbi:hypothetical protein [Opitutus terrae]|uniref:DUF4345 domain-containing protein n=1 Tax=Opitutus terrae (strain DSM 11246 / JCM 15787 / PB90-1) TaxID=452637 RepID=B1ZYP1_OPITP|nr:hypothetical protein [Opitutus terrae]ACB75277.1 hypothetical protein Oter_1994 [Opitutus terrae PB90-1]
MKTAKVLLLASGVANGLFFLFHLYMGWQLHHLQVAPGLRALLEMFNGGGALFILFLTYASLLRAEEILTSRLGTAVLVLGSGLYLLRAVAEFVVAPHARPAIYLTCLVTGGLYLGALLLRRSSQPRTA